MALDFKIEGLDLKNIGFENSTLKIFGFGK